MTTFTAGSQEQTLPIWIFQNLFRPNQAPVVNVVAAVLVLLSVIPIYLRSGCPPASPSPPPPRPEAERHYCRSMTGLDVAGILAQLTLEEKASLCLGSDFWHTAPVERLGIPAVMVADGPHGLRKQPEEGEQAGLSGSNPATCFPTAAALASSWDVDLLRRVGEALGARGAGRGGRRAARARG